MKIKSLFVIPLIVGILCWGTVSIGAEDEFVKSPASGPVRLPEAVLAKAKHEFATVVEGTVVTHDFVLRNKGAALLEIKKVRTG